MWKIYFLRLFLHKNKSLFLICFLLFFNLAFSQQPLTVTGSVYLGSDRRALPGVSVQVKGTSLGTTTNAAGTYSLSVQKAAILVFSSVGFVEREITVGDETTINVTLDPANQDMEQVVVVGYGQQKKASVVAAISTIRTKDIKQSPSANLSVTLAGRLPGLTSIQRTGEPGRDAIELFIRGRSTVNEQKPLLMVDGVEREFNSLDPNEIESVSILKDASATAIYGVRGANGVILVTTRRGVADKPEINFSSEYGLTDFTRFPKTVRAYDFALLRNQTLINGGGAPQYNQQDLDHYRTGDYPERYPDHDWYNEFTKDYAPQTRYNLNVSGGTKTVRYFVSAGYFNQQGLFKADQTEWDATTNLKRYNFRSNIDMELTKTLKATLNAAGYLEKQNSPAGLAGFNSPSSIIIVNALISAPSNVANVLTPQGEVVFFPGGGGDHPIYGMINRSGYVLEDRNNVQSTFALEQQLDFFTKGLSVKAQFSFDSRAINTQIRSRQFARYRQVVGRKADGSDSLYYTQYADQNTPLGIGTRADFQSYSNVQLSLNYARQFSADHNVTGLILFNQDKRSINSDIPYNLRGLAGRATYGYKNRYFGEFNFGYNGSEQFAKNQRYGFFPSISAGWLLSNESFVRDHLSFISTMKLRASYGIAGNDRFGTTRFIYLDDYRANGGVYSNLGAGVNETLIANPDVTWERSKKLNVGLETLLFRSLGLNVDLFSEKRDNILAKRGTIPTVFGSVAYAPQNIGKVENKGIEIELTYTAHISRVLDIQARANIAYAKNTVTFLDEPLLPANYKARTRSTGYSIGQQFGLETSGYFSDSTNITKWPDQSRFGIPRAGDFRYVDQNGDGKVDDADIVPIGFPTVPNLNYGFSFSVTYKNIDLSILLQGTAQASQYIQGQGVWEGANFYQRHLESWTPARVAAGLPINYPRLSFTSNVNKRLNDFFLERSDFIRLKNAEIGYSLPLKWSEKIYAKRIRFYANGLNLFVWDKLKSKDYDPEFASGNGAAYPLSRVINFGANLTF